ncbi:MAG TPA: hypothetical protein VEY51_03165, partial [Chondromyces sp.]|nr:hypothetical protein [Chondromyces sp.]
NEMEILYWAPNGESEEMIYESMKKTYAMIHKYKDEEIYGEAFDPVRQVLVMDENKTDDILESLD